MSIFRIVGERPGSVVPDGTHDSERLPGKI